MNWHRPILRELEKGKIYLCCDNCKKTYFAFNTMEGEFERFTLPIATKDF